MTFRAGKEAFVGARGRDETPCGDLVERRTDRMASAKIRAPRFMSWDVVIGQGGVPERETAGYELKGVDPERRVFQTLRRDWKHIRVSSALWAAIALERKRHVFHTRQWRPCLLFAIAKK